MNCVYSPSPPLPLDSPAPPIPPPPPPPPPTPVRLATLAGLGQLGGGCELAMLCDILLCTPTSTFSQPEITLGIIPGSGGTQRLTNLIGKARAMDMVLTGRRITGVQAAEWGLASRVISDGQSVVEEAVKVGDAIAGFGQIAVQAGKEAVNGGERAFSIISA